jgi:hypothetical protein
LIFEIFPFSFDIFTFRPNSGLPPVRRDPTGSRLFFPRSQSIRFGLWCQLLFFLLRKAISWSFFSSFYFVVGNKGYILEPRSSLIFCWYFAVGTTRLSNRTFLCLSFCFMYATCDRYITIEQHPIRYPSLSDVNKEKVVR